MLHPAADPSTRIGAGDGTIRNRDQLDSLGDVLEAIAIEALQRETPRWLERQEARRVRIVVGGPVAAATRAAIDRLEAELTSTLGRAALSLDAPYDDERRRVELGLD